MTDRQKRRSLVAAILGSQARWETGSANGGCPRSGPRRTVPGADCAGGQFAGQPLAVAHVQRIGLAAGAYRGVIPPDRWHEPYMTERELADEIAAGVTFWGYEADGELLGVMGRAPRCCARTGRSPSARSKPRSCWRSIEAGPPRPRPGAEDSPARCRSLGRVDIQRATSGLDQYAIADSYAPSSAGRDAAGVREGEPQPEPEQAAAPAEEPLANPAPALPGVYARNARAVALRMATPSISLLA
jgi:hypothetical protein